jgi:hypothetical protein
MIDLFEDIKKEYNLHCDMDFAELLSEMNSEQRDAFNKAHGFVPNFGINPVDDILNILVYEIAGHNLRFSNEIVAKLLSYNVIDYTDEELEIFDQDMNKEIDRLFKLLKIT